MTAHVHVVDGVTYECHIPHPAPSPREFVHGDYCDADLRRYSCVCADQALASKVAAAIPAPELDVERLANALERVDPVAFPLVGSVALDRENVDHFRYAEAIASAYAEDAP